MKSLKFSEPLLRLILNGKKTNTWRIDDDKDISEGDMISLCDNKGMEFAKAKVVSAKLTAFKDITGEDMEGHESFASDEKMLSTYSKYYKAKITKDTALKVIKFELV